MRPAQRKDLAALAVEVAPRLLGAHLRVTTADGVVTIRVTEVEAYHGKGTGDVADPGSHARMGITARNSTMWGEAGHLYVYLSHGIHSCVNVVAGPAGQGDGILLRAGEVVEGIDLARKRRALVRDGVAKVPRDRDLARGPGSLGQAIGLRHPQHDGIDAIDGVRKAGALVQLLLPAARPWEIASGPRVGVAGIAGTSAYPWRYWINGDPTVSSFRPGRGAVEAEAAVPALTVPVVVPLLD